MENDNATQREISGDFELQYRTAGVHQRSWAEAVVDAAYEECAELRTTDRASARERILEDTESVDRTEFRVLHRGTVVAVCTIVLEWDAHVGACYSMHWSYVLPEYRDAGPLRRAYLHLARYAKQHGIAYAYTKRTGPGEYVLKYGGLSWVS